MALSDAACRGAKPNPKPHRLGDGNGLFLLVQPSGSKAWQYFYRFQGRQKILSIGRYPAISLSDARDLRDKATRELAFGRDPKEARLGVVPSGSTFQEIATAHVDAWKVGKSESHVARVWSRLERDAFPEIGKKDIVAITSADVLAMIRKVEARGAIDVSKRLKQKVGEIFAFAIAEGKATVDPTQGLHKALKPRPKVKRHAMVGSAGLTELLLAIDGYDGDAITRLALKFTLLTGVRTSESRFMTWPEVEGKLWRIPAERMKMHREHLVPLSRQARSVLDEARAMGRGQYVFSNSRGETLSANTMIFALYRMGFHSRQTVHGFRRLFSTILNEQGFNRDWIELQLAHGEDDDIRAAYNAAQHLPGRTRMMQWWADRLDAETADRSRSRKRASRPPPPSALQ
jgi:integrase